MSAHYDFTTLVNRTQTGSRKWNEMNRAFPKIPSSIPPFSVADADLVLAPEISEGLQEYIKTSVIGYPELTKEYIDAVIDWNKRRHNWTIQPEWLLTSSGIVPNFYTAIQAFTKETDHVVIFSPIYYPFTQAIHDMGRTLVESPLVIRNHHYEIDFDDLESKFADPNASLFFLCSPHNPVGRVWTEDELEKIAQLAEQYKVLVLADEIHNDLITPGYHHTVYGTLSPAVQNNCIICAAPSKSFNIAGLQGSYVIIANEEIRSRFQAAQARQGFQIINSIAIKATELAYTKAEPWLEEFIELIQHNYQLAKEFIHRRLPKVILHELEGTYLLWMDFNPYGYSEEELVQKLANEAHIVIDEGSMFGETGRGYIRFNIACPTQTLMDALERMATAFESESLK